MKQAELNAYAVGYFHGRSEGVYRDNLYEGDLRHFYKQGYDSGVADYCVVLEGENHGN